MTNQSQNPNDPKSPSKGGQQQPQQAQDDSHTNSARAGERPDPNRKASTGTQHGSNTPQGGQQQGMEPERSQPGSQQHGSQGNQGQQGGQSGQKSNDPSRGGK